MSTDNVSSLLDRKAKQDEERCFLDLIERDIQANPGNVRPIPSSLFDRYESIKAKMLAAQVEELKEG